MADKHPYVQAPGNLGQVLTHLRRSFPASLTADTLKKLGFAPQNESYVLNVVRFLGLIDAKGEKTTTASDVFSEHDDSAFQKKFGDLVRGAYSGLFELYEDDTWTRDTNDLITFFRQTDQTTALVGKHQARTFQVLAGFAGHRETPSARVITKKPVTKDRTREHGEKPLAKTATQERPRAGKQDPGFGLTVRIEINLPADGDQETYDRIFRSIRENLLNA